MAKQKHLRVTAPAPKKAIPGKAVELRDDDGLIRVRLGRLDLDGPWCLTKAPGDLRTVLDAIRKFETMRVHECFANGGHPGKDYALRDLPNPQARTRLAEMKLDDHEQISRLRVNGPGRLYGFRHRLDFWALWWDPRHEIWPSQK